MYKFDDINTILSEISNNNKEAFTALYNTYWEEIFNYTLKKVGSTYIAEDIVHDLFLSIWKNRAKISEINNIKAYIFSASRYLCIAHFHKNNVVNYNIDINELEIDTDETPIENKLYYRYLLDLLHEEIENLPEKCKLIFKESRFNHKSIKQIALEYNLSESTVENHINRALKSLKTASNNFLSVAMFLF